MQTLVERLRIRATIRRQISTRKSVQENKPDRLADLLEEAANEISIWFPEFGNLNGFHSAEKQKVHA